MSSLVLELQQEAVSPRVKVTDLLRKALVVAGKLNIREFKEWIEQELHGYKGAEIPKYSHLKGELKASHPYYGWIPYIVTDVAVGEALSSRPNNQPIGELEHMLERLDQGASFVMPFEQELLNKLDQGNLESSLRWLSINHGFTGS